jgi:drug/metabolite transporter (DMT)-like permease
MSRSSWLPIVGLLLAMLLWASSFVALKFAFQTYDPMVVIFGRMFVGTLCFVFFVKRFQRVNYQAGDWKPLLIMVLCEPCLYFIFESWSLTLTTASQSAMIASMMPLMVAVIAPFLLKESLAPRTWAGFVVAVIGAVWLSAKAPASDYAPNPALGNFLEFLAMAFGAGYTVMLKRLSLRYSPLFLTGLQAAAGTIFFFPLMFLPPTTLPTTWVWEPVLAIVYLGVFITLGAYGLFSFGVSRIPASRAAAFVNLIPVFAVILGWLVLNETLTPEQLAASGLVIAGVVLSQKKPSAGVT